MPEFGGRIGRTVCLVVAVAVAGALAAAELPREWRNWSHFREIEIKTSGQNGELARVLVPESLYAHARSDLADLRLIDQAGSEMGYVLYSPGRGRDFQWRPVEMNDSGVVPDQYFQLVADTGDEDLVHNAIEVTLGRGDGEFFAWTEVAASGDRESWRIVRRRAPLYWFDEEGSRGPVTIRYPRTRDRWLRLRLLDSGDDIQVNKLRVAERGGDERARLAIGRGMALSSDAPKGESVWKPHGTLPLIPISGIRFETGRDAFHRPVVISASDDGEIWRQVGRGYAYRFRAADGEDLSERQGLEIDVRETAAPYWRVTVMDRGDPPIDDLEVRLLRDLRNVVFKPAEAGSYRLLYGNHLAKNPEYELAKLVTGDELAVAREVDLHNERANEAYSSPEPFTERHPIILWAALGLAVLVVGGLALKTLR